MATARWQITESAHPLSKHVRVFNVRKGFDEATVDVQWGTTYCEECPAPLAGERTSCRHALAVRRYLARNPAVGAPTEETATNG